MDKETIKKFKCPKCGSEELIGKQLYDELTAQGKYTPAPGITPCLFAQPLFLLDPQKQALSVPILEVLEDICAKCGTRYIFQLNLEEKPITAVIPKQQHGPQRGMNPFFGRS